MNDNLAFFIFFGALIFGGIFSFYALWLVFVEASKPGWAVIIPGYAQYTMATLAKKSPRTVWAFTVFGIVAFIAQMIAYITVTQLATNINNALALCLFIFMIYIVICMAKQYRGVSKGFWVAYLILPFLCLFEIRKLEYKK